MTKEEDPSFGLEDEPHTTLLYGLHEEVTLKQVENILDGYTYYTCKVSNPSLFKNEEFDVLKFDVTGDNLHETNKSLKELPHTSTYPNYHPHLTIGYIKPGKGQRYVDIINDLDETEYWLAPKYAVYSQPNGKKTKINIRID
jgi:2'-5' RNA ligase